MKPSLIARVFRFVVETQLWIALCATVSSGATTLILEHRYLSWPYGLLIFGIVLCTYSLYYIKNTKYPFAPYIASIGGFITSIGYAHLDFPKLELVLILIALSCIYMLPQGAKTKRKLMLRWGVLSLIWTLFLFYFPLKNYPNNLIAACWFANRFFFIGNLCFIFLLKDEMLLFTTQQISLARNILMIGQAISILSIAFGYSMYLALAISIPYLMLLGFYKWQTHQSGIYFYSLGIDGLLILESIFVQSLFIYGARQLSAF